MPGIDFNQLLNSPTDKALIMMGIIFLLVTFMIVKMSIPVVRDLTGAMNRLSSAVEKMEGKIALQNESIEDLQQGLARIEGRRFGFPAMGTVAAAAAAATWIIGRRL